MKNNYRSTVKQSHMVLLFSQRVTAKRGTALQSCVPQFLQHIGPIVNSEKDNPLDLLLTGPAIIHPTDTTAQRSIQ